MVYNPKQYDPVRDFIQTGDDNVVEPLDKLRVQAYDLYENLYINSTFNLKIIIRGDENHALLMPSGRKLVEATNRFLGLNIDYLVEGEGDAGTQKDVDDWFKAFFKREAFKTKFESNKRWGLIRGDSAFMLYADPNKPKGARISIKEVDPRQIFNLENDEQETTGYYIVERVPDPEDHRKHIAKRTSYKEELDDNGQPTGRILHAVSFFSIGKWDDRDSENEIEPIPNVPADYGALAEEPLPDAITQLPIYRWRNSPMQNTDWGTSQLSGLETLLLGINQSLTDEDATIVFQGLGMYMTNAAPPIDPNTGQITDWNIGPMQVIEIGQDQTFTRVTGVTDLSPFQDHISFMDEKGLSESSGIPEVAIGRVDVQAAESGISLTLQLMPLLAANAEKELEFLTIVDQMFHDITSQWLPAYESESFDALLLSEISVVTIFDDPLPRDRNAEIQETILLQTSNLILTSMAIAKLRSLGWKYPTVDDQGNMLTDEDIANMLHDQAAAQAAAVDPFASATSNLDSFDSATGVGNAASNLQSSVMSPNNPNGQGPSKQTVTLAGS